MFAYKMWKMPTWTWKQWHLLFRTMGVWWELPDKARVFDKCEFCSPGGIQWSLTCGNLKFVVTVVQSINRAWLCDPLKCSTAVFLVLHCLLEFAQTHVHWVSDAMQPSHPLSSPSPPAFSLSQHQVFSRESVLCIRWPNYWSPASASVLPVNIQS